MLSNNNEKVSSIPEVGFLNSLDASPGYLSSLTPVIQSDDFVKYFVAFLLHNCILPDSMTYSVIHIYAFFPTELYFVLVDQYRLPLGMVL